MSYPAFSSGSIFFGALLIVLGLALVAALLWRLRQAGLLLSLGLPPPGS